MRIFILSIAFVLTGLNVSSNSLETYSNKSVETIYNKTTIHQNYEDGDMYTNENKFSRLKANICRSHFVLNNEVYVRFCKKTLKLERIKEVVFDAYYEVYKQIVLSKSYNVPSEENFRVFLKFDKLQTKMMALVNRNTRSLEKQLKGIHGCDKILNVFGI